MAHFEIHILNYNGAHYLPVCLKALNNLNMAGHTAQVNVVDNGSTDESKILINSEYPWARFIPLNRNWGYSGGNNKGAWRASELYRTEVGKDPDFHVFLNNDTEVQPNWLLSAAEVFEQDKKVGIVGSKSLFFDSFAAIRVAVSPAYEPRLNGSSDTRILGAFLVTPLEGENIYPDERRVRWKEAFPPERGGRWLPSTSTFYVPVKDPDASLELNLRLRFVEEHGENITVQCFVNNSTTARVTHSCSGGELVNLPLSISPKDYVKVIQNIGSFVTPNWDAGDIGHGEIDTGQHDARSDVSAICGVSMFIRHSLFKELGGFDQNYFAYFEDTDLCVRAWLKGYTCKVASTSVLRHIHCGSSGGEGSRMFNRLVSFSHLLFNNKFAAPQQWRIRQRELVASARAQFEAYLNDRSLEDKPQLQTRLRYMKLYPVFAANRFNRWRNAVALSAYPFRTRAGVLLERGAPIS